MFKSLVENVEKLFKLFVNAVTIITKIYFFEFVVVYCKVRDTCCITVNVVGSGFGYPSSKPGQGCLHFT